MRCLIFSTVALVCMSLLLLGAGVQPAQADFNLTRAISGVYYSKIAYCQADHIQSWTGAACPHFPGVTNVTAHADADNDSQGYVAYNPSEHQIVYAFRGTIDLQGWIEDGDFFQIPYNVSGCDGCLVHEGLFWGYTTLARTLLPKLQELVNAMPDADILVTGHSMGAAHAGFAFLDVVLNVKGHTGTKRMYNYGCPRLGNPAFVAFNDLVAEPHKEHFRSTNFGDPIPHLAPIVFDKFGLGNWLHIPREIFHMNPFGNPAHYKICAGNTTMEDPTCADSTPWYDMIGFRNHTTYYDIGLGCFLGPPRDKVEDLFPFSMNRKPVLKTLKKRV